MNPFDGRDLTAREFLEWAEFHEERCELVEGRVVRLPASTQARGVAATNILCALGPQAKARGIRATVAATAVLTAPATVRYPVLVLDAGPPDAGAMLAGRPVLVAEVTSLGHDRAAADVRLAEYRALDSVRACLAVDPDGVLVELSRRLPTGDWKPERYDDLDAVIELPRIGVALALADVYDTLVPTGTVSARR